VVNALNIPPGGQSEFTLVGFGGINFGGIDLESFSPIRRRDLLDLLDRTHPGAFFIRCRVDVLKEIPEQRRRNRKRKYIVPVHSDKELIDNATVLVTRVQWTLFFATLCPHSARITTTGIHGREASNCPHGSNLLKNKSKFDRSPQKLHADKPIPRNPEY